ncbi:MAG: SH3 domain-containing protein [Deltaproteobacteria bacterium]|nr:SH3 domain-containing protein [Deltaproteobacteria bacterium]
MKKILLFTACMAVVGLSLFPAYGSESLWVTSEGAKLKSDHSASSDTVSTLPIGAQLTVLQSEDRWYRVRTASGDEGWIYRGKVSNTPPEKGAEDTGNLFAGMQGSGISADEAQTSRSIRGLSKETQQYAKKRGTPEAYQKALDQVLAMKLTTKELEVFLKDGKIGEYAP